MQVCESVAERQCALCVRFWKRAEMLWRSKKLGKAPVEILVRDTSVKQVGSQSGP